MHYTCSIKFTLKELEGGSFDILIIIYQNKTSHFLTIMHIVNDAWPQIYQSNVHVIHKNFTHPKLPANTVINLHMCTCTCIFNMCTFICTCTCYIKCTVILC